MTKVAPPTTTASRSALTTARSATCRETMRIILPSSERQAIDLIRTYGYMDYTDLEQKLVLPVVRNALRITANLMSARESYSEKRANFVFWTWDQIQWGIHLTQVTTTCSMVCHGRFPARSARVRSSLLDERSLPRLSVSAAMARRFPLPALRRTKSLAVA